MKNGQKTSLIGGIIALIFSLSCCWVPALIVAFGGAAGLMSFSDTLESYSGILMIVSGLLLAYAGYKYYQVKNSPEACCTVEESSSVG